MEPLGQKLRRQRLRLGLTLDEVAGRASISKPYLSLIETGRVPNPPSDEKLRRLEQSLGFGSGELISQAHLQRTPRDVRAVLNQLLQESGGESPTATATSASADQPALSEILQRLLGKAGENNNQPTGIPVINKVAGGYPTNFTDLSYPSQSADDYVGCPEVQDKDAFAARVTGDSMIPKYTEGNIVIFSPAMSARDGDDCFVCFDDGKTTFRRVFFESDENGEPLLRLQPRNEKYRAQTISAEKVAGLHRAVFRYERVND